MTVGIDVTIDPSGAVSGGRTADRALDQIETSADNMTSSVNRGNAALRNVKPSADQAAKSSNALRQQIGNASFQIQDFIVQVQSGTSATTAFAQQAPQLFSAFSPVLGLVVSLGTVLGGAYLTGLLGATDATEDLDKAIESLNTTISIGDDGVVQFTSSVAKLAATNEQAARSQIALAINQTVEAMTAANAVVSESLTQFDSLFSFLGGNAVVSLDSARTGLDNLDATLVRTGLSTEELLTQTDLYSTGLSTLSRFVSTVSDELGVTTDQALSLVRAMDGFETQRSPEAMQQLADTVNSVNEATGFANETLVKLAQVVNENTITSAQYADVMSLLKSALADVGAVIEQNTESFARQKDVVLAMSQQLLILQERNTGNNREAAQMAAVFRSGAEEGSTLAKQISLLAGQIFDAEQKQKTLNNTTKEYDKDGQYVARLQDQVDALGMTGAELALFNAQQKLSSEATGEQTAKVRELTLALLEFQETTAAQKADQQLDVEANVLFSAVTPTDTLTEQLEQQRELILEFQELGIGDAQAAADALVAIDTARYVNQTNIAASGFGSLTQLAKGFAGDQSGIYKALFAVQKGFTLASVLLSSSDAIGKAWASAPFPANLPAVATTVVETGALKAAVDAVTPAFANGGLAFGPGTGTSDSFTARLSNGEFVMPAAATRNNLPELEAMRAGRSTGGQTPSQPRISIINQTTGRIDNATAEFVTADEVRVILTEELPDAMAGQVQDPYSPANSALQSSYDIPRKVG